MKMLNCKCGERVRVSSDAIGVRCARCTMFGKARLSDAELGLAKVASELGWPKNGKARAELAWELAMVWASCGLGHVKAKAVEEGILLALNGERNVLGDWHIRACFENAGDEMLPALPSWKEMDNGVPGVGETGALRTRRPATAKGGGEGPRRRF